MPDATQYWTVWLGQGLWSHAAWHNTEARTLCGRSTANAREWVQPGSEPGCNRCHAALKKSDTQIPASIARHLSFLGGGGAR